MTVYPDNYCSLPVQEEDEGDHPRDGDVLRDHWLALQVPVPRVFVIFFAGAYSEFILFASSGAGKNSYTAFSHGMLVSLS